MTDVIFYKKKTYAKTNAVHSHPYCIFFMHSVKTKGKNLRVPVAPENKFSTVAPVTRGFSGMDLASWHRLFALNCEAVSMFLENLRNSGKNFEVQTSFTYLEVRFNGADNRGGRHCEG